MQKDISFIENRVSAKGSLWKKRVSDSKNISLLKKEMIFQILLQQFLLADMLIPMVLMIFSIQKLINYLKIRAVYLILIME